MDNSLVLFAKDVWTFNEIAGNNLNTSLESFNAQQRCLVEEVNEITEGLNNKNVEEVVDGVIDTLYVAIGMLHKLAELGVNVDDALYLIAKNNLSKFPEKSKFVIDETLEQYKNKGINLTYSFVRNPYDNTSLVVFKDENGKIRKPFGFESVDISSTIKGVSFDV